MQECRLKPPEKCAHFFHDFHSLLDLHKHRQNTEKETQSGESLFLLVNLGIRVELWTIRVPDENLGIPRTLRGSDGFRASIFLASYCGGAKMRLPSVARAVVVNFHSVRFISYANCEKKSI